MSILRRKVWRDLWNYKGRTLQVVLIIAMGAFAIGLIVGTRNMVVAGMEEIWQASSPAMIHLATFPRVDDDALAVLERVEDVTGVEGYADVSIEWRLSPNDRWQPGNLIARNDYEDQRFAQVDLLSGNWPHRRVLAVGQGSDVAFDIQEGGQIYLRVDDREYVVDVGGVIYDPNVQPPSFGGNANFYTTRNRLEDMTGSRDFNRILATATRYDETLVTTVADDMQNKLERQGVRSGGFAPPNGSRFTDPAKHFFQDVMDGIFFILGFMAFLALVLGLFLVYNTITAIISQQISQIGVMKAVGASAGKVLSLYLLNVSAYGFLALLVALPLGIVGAHLLGTFLLDSFNAESEFVLSTSAIVAQAIVALLSPLVACLVPIFTGARITVREAIKTYGLSAGSSLLDRALAKIQRIPQMVSLTISNTFRHKQRVFLTQLTLVLSGMIFMTVMSARDTTVYTFDELLFSIFEFNVNFQLDDLERIDRVEELTLSQPGVKAVEMWRMDNTAIRLASQPESDDDESTLMVGVPLPTALYGPQIRAGRWLRPEDTYAVVLNQILAEDAGVGVGDTVTLNHGGSDESDWLVVGLLFDPVITNSAHVPRDVMLREVRSVNKAGTVWIQTEQNNPAAELAAAEELREFYTQNRLEVNAGGVFGQDTATEVIDNILGQFAIIITLLATMAVVIGIVGSIALSGVLSLNVLERTREIGVLRAIGASSSAIGRLFVGEGMILGWLSWLIALPLSIPAGKLMAQGLGSAVNIDLVYKFTPIGALCWLGIITVLSVAASWFPARGATRISVRESLAYE
ncbi:MAG: ABC transporter permease [Chloroflexi bacterium]|nr:ABC transporter permease [Chloroflexota bacterium]